MTASVARFIESFIPENYNLFLDINRSEKTFTGNVAITGEAIDNHISLHQKDLTINSVLLDNESLNFQMDDANEAFHIELPETGVLTIFIEFSGRITDNMTGIYPSYYTYNGEKKEIISTQFESHFAREAFPCVDEPEAKATFDLSLKFDAEEGDTALSNMPEINSHLRPLGDQGLHRRRCGYGLRLHLRGRGRTLPLPLRLSGSQTLAAAAGLPGGMIAFLNMFAHIVSVKSSEIVTICYRL